MPKVSVIVPVFNVENYLKKSLNSLKEQSLDDVEVICINNGSTDNSPKILEEYKNSPKFKIISHNKKSIGAVRNEGIDISKGDYIAFMDSDDTFERNALGELYSQAKEQSPDVILFNYQKVDDKGKPMENGLRSVAKCVEGFTDLKNRDTFDWKRIKPKVFGLNGSFWAAWSKFFNGEFLKDNRIRFADCNLCEDHHFTVESLLKAKKIGYNEKPVYNYFVRPGTASRRTVSKEEASKVLGVFGSMKELLEKMKLERELKKEFHEYIDKTNERILPYMEAPDEFQKVCKDEFLAD